MEATTHMATRMPIKDAAEYKGVSIDTIRRRLRRGELTGEFVDGKWLVDIDDTDGGALSGASQLALRVLSEQVDRLSAAHDREVQRLTAENERLVGIIEMLVKGDPEKKSLWDRMKSG